MALKDLLQLFGNAWLAKVRQPMTRNQLPGKHYLGKSHFSGAQKIHQKRRPAGSKLLKRFHPLQHDPRLNK
jgi:hypothetical protein